MFFDSGCNHFSEDDDFDAEDLVRFFINCDFNPAERTVLIFNVEMTVQTLQLAFALLRNRGTVDECIHVLRAAWALRNVTGVADVQESTETRDWNRQHSVGRLVRFWPAGRNGESFLSRTTSPAFDTPSGPVLLVDDHTEAVSLLNVDPSSVSCQEVAL